MPTPTLTAAEAADLLAILAPMSFPGDVQERMDDLKKKLGYIAEGVDIVGQIAVKTSEKADLLAQVADIDAEIALLNEELSQMPPVANAGADQSVAANATVTLDGSASTNPAGTVMTYKWTQTAGPAVVITNSTSAIATFVAPVVAADTLLTFKLKCTAGALDNTDKCDVIVRL